jgi:predicted aspartyl protease
MRIYKDVRFKGAKGGIIKQSLIDTGASISLVPVELANSVGAWHTNQNLNIVGVHGQKRKLPLEKMGIFFPDLENKGGYLVVSVSDIEETPIIGMDILKPLGINIDTKTGELSIKNEIWEAFKTLSGIGIAVLKTMKKHHLTGNMRFVMAHFNFCFVKLT